MRDITIIDRRQENSKTFVGMRDLNDKAPQAAVEDALPVFVPFWLRFVSHKKGSLDGKR